MGDQLDSTYIHILLENIDNDTPKAFYDPYQSHTS